MPQVPTVPFRVDFEITSQCNLDCGYCSAKPFSRTAPSLEQLTHLFEKTEQEVNPFDVLIEGGEPFTRKDIISVLTVARRTFGEIAVATNGTLIPRLSNKELSDLREIVANGSLQVSLDSIEEAMNDLLRGGTQLIIRGLDKLEQQDIPFSIGIVLTAHSISTLSDTMKFLLARYTRLTKINLLNLYPSLALGNSYFALKPSETEIARALETSSKARNSFGRSDVEIRMLKGHGETNVALAGQECGLCTAGLTRAGVLYNGDVVPCTMIRTARIGNLFTQSWPEIWEKSLHRYRMLQNEKVTGQQCDINLNFGAQLLTDPVSVEVN